MVTIQDAQVERQVLNNVDEHDHVVKHPLRSVFRAHGCLSNHDVGFDHYEGVVVLRGHVGSFYEKQMAQELARKVAGVKMIINRLVVDSSLLGRCQEVGLQSD